MASHAAARSRFADRLSEARAELRAGHQAAALAVLFQGLTPDADYVEQARAAKLLAGIELEALGLRPLRVALVAGSTMDHLAPVLRFWLARAGFAAEMLILPFDTERLSVLDDGSELYAFRPQVVWLFSTHRDVEIAVPPGSTADAVLEEVRRAVAARKQLWTHLLARLDTVVLQNNADLPAEDPLGNLAGASPWGRRTALRLYNVELAAAAMPGVVLFDLDHVAGCWGKVRWTDPRYWFHSRHAFALDATGPLACAAARLIASVRGLAKKCLVVDLDNTLWGGVIGDDGLEGIRLGGDAAGEAHAAFQTFLKALKDRGVILAACSKNDPEAAALPFRQHPDSVLRLDDFAAFVANWRNKVENLREIARMLGIGLDSMVFVDDDPVERDIVRRHLPEVEVIDLPDDPAAFVMALAQPGWFETVALSAEDRERSRHYAENARRAELREAAVDMDAYLASLGMTASVGPTDALHLPRFAQLINKSNQFHLTGTRYAEAEVKGLAERPDWFLRFVRLRDRFGDNGLIACVILRRVERALHIDTWCMSCRVLGRRVEEFVANEMLAVARHLGCESLVGRYVRSPRNGLVAGLYERLGFTLAAESATGSTWTLEVSDDHPGWRTSVRRDDGSEGQAGDG